MLVCRSGKYVIAFLDRSPLCLVAVSSLAEPPAVLRMQLAMVHGQVTSLLTASAMAAVFTKSPGFDARRLLGGADVMLDSLISGFSADPSALLGAYPTLALMRGVRTAVLQSLRHAMQASGSLFGLMLGAGCVVASAAAGRQPLQQWDVLLLLNFLNSNESLKQAETITPLCLPSYNANGHLHAYINYLDPTTGAAIVLLAGSRTSDFHSMSAARQGLVDALATNGALQSVLDACKAHGSAETMASVKSVERVLTNASLSPDALLHFAYKLTRPQQFVMSSFSSCSDALRQVYAQPMNFYLISALLIPCTSRSHNSGVVSRLIRLVCRILWLPTVSCGQACLTMQGST